MWMIASVLFNCLIHNIWLGESSIFIPEGFEESLGFKSEMKELHSYKFDVWDKRVTVDDNEDSDDDDDIDLEKGKLYK